jgi:hypothetical protein
MLTNFPSQWERLTVTKMMTTINGAATVLSVKRG